MLHHCDAVGDKEAGGRKRVDGLQRYRWNGDVRCLSFPRCVEIQMVNEVERKTNWSIFFGLLFFVSSTWWEFFIGCYGWLDKTELQAIL